MDKPQVTNQRKAGTGKSAVGIAVIVLMIIVIVAAIAYALMQPGVLESVINKLHNIQGVYQVSRASGK